MRLLLAVAATLSIETSHANSAESQGAIVDALAVLADFEDGGSLVRVVEEEAEASRRPSSTDDGHALEIRFSPDVHIPRVRLVPAEPWDCLSGGDANLAFDATNLGDTSMQLYVDVVDALGARQQHAVSLPAGFEGTVYFPFTGDAADVDPGLWGRPSSWPQNSERADELKMIWRSWHTAIDRSEVASLEFSMIGTLAEHRVVIDKVRLRENPPVDPDWLRGLADKFGQSAKVKTPLHVGSSEELRRLAEAERSELSKSAGMPDRSRFGGYKDGPRLEATGYFRTQKVDGKWWMVDPEGYLFFSHGPANVRIANLTTLTGIDYRDDRVRIVRDDVVTPEDSIGIVAVSDQVRSTRYVASDLRRGMFDWLPGYDDPLADHYSYRRSTHRGPLPHGETFSFYRANLERRYGQTGPESYLQTWHEVTLDRMKAWGFTSFGNWVDPAFYEHRRVPFFANGWIIGDFKTLSGEVNHWGLMPDPYDPVFAERTRATIAILAEEVKGSPWCIGIFLDNEKSWGEREGSVAARYGVILDALSKDARESPAKAAFLDHLKSKYGTIKALNDAWDTGLASWDALAAGVEFERHTDQQVADLSQMLELLGEQYFKVVHNTLEKSLPNHLYMGARMANWGMPDEVIKASLKYSDVLSFNIYEEGMQPSRWAFLDEVDLPVVIGEFHIGSTQDTGMLHPGIVHASDQRDRARMYKQYMDSLLEKPYMVGAHWFQYVDEPLTGRAFDGENAQIGFVTVADIPYPELIRAVKEVNRSLYPRRYGK